MISLKRIIWCMCLPTIVAGCELTPDQFETPPVTVKTSQGFVSCQLYSHDYVLWDRAIDWPNVLNGEQADRYCQQEGRRKMAERKGGGS